MYSWMRWPSLLIPSTRTSGGRVCKAHLSSSSILYKETPGKSEEGKGRGRVGGGGLQKKRARRGPVMSPYKVEDVNINSDWPSIYQAPRPFDPYAIPLPIRMGRAVKGSFPPPAVGNLELMKIPNFFHLTPPAIEKHCEALKSLCTPWPDRLPQLPIKIETRNYVFPDHSVRHPGARKVVLTVCLKDLMLSEQARNKMIALAGPRYIPDKDTIRLIGKRCPTRKQNHDYVMYLLKVLYLESNRMEPWEVAKNEESAG